MQVKIKKAGRPDPTQTMSQFPNLYGYNPIGNIESNTTGTIDENISSTLKPVDRENATIEAEKGEVLVKPELLGLYKIGGKTHAKGGTPLAAEEGSFIFSNDKSMRFSKAELKALGITSKLSKENSTPAKVILKKVKPEEYNSALNTIQDSKMDIRSKTSAALNLMNHQKDLGEVAFMQEQKKKVQPPQFATVPNNPDLDRIEDVSLQYMAGGGIVAWPGDKTTGRDNKSKYTTDQWRQFAKDIGYNGPNDNKSFQKYLYNDPRFSYVIKDLHTQGVPGPNNGWNDGMIGMRWDVAQDWWNTKVPLPPNNFGPTPDAPALPSQQTTQPVSNPNTPQVSGPKVGTKEWQGFDFQPNALELFSAALPGIQALTMPTYYDMLQQRHTPNIRLDRVNDKETQQGIAENSSLAQREAYNNLAGNQAQAVTAQVRGSAANMSGQSENQMNNANTQIANQESLINYQSMTNDLNFNQAAIQENYRNNTLSRQRANEMRTNGFTQVVNNIGNLTQNLEAMSNTATMMALSSVGPETDENGNRVIRYDKNGKPYTQMGVPLNFNNRRRPVFDPRYGGINSYLASQYGNQGSTQEILQSATKRLKDALDSGDNAAIDSATRAYYSILRSGGRGESPLENARSLNTQLYNPIR